MMASDLSSECTEATGALDEKEEGEISLEDVSSSEEGHANYGYGSRAQCSNCLSSQHITAWCTIPAKSYPYKGPRREIDLILQEAIQGKENRHQIKESGSIGAKHVASTLQEKNDDLVSISSDSDMEIVGLMDNSKQITLHGPKSRGKKKKKNKRNHAIMLTVDDLVSTSPVNVPAGDAPVKHAAIKTTSRSRRREVSPVHRNSESRISVRTPPRRRRSLVRARSPFRRSKSPTVRVRSPVPRRSPRRLKSPKRSPYRSSIKTVARKTSHTNSVSSHNYIETQKLLKKVRHLESIGTQSLEETLNKNKEHASSLKEKLSNMMKGVTDNNNGFTSSSKEKSTDRNEFNDADDEEDLALLRQKALETKQNKSSKQNGQSKGEMAKSTNVNDNQDEEDLLLRAIALRSAVLKKHQKRIQKGKILGKYKKPNGSRSGSPFTQSFLDSIPIPGEDLLNFASLSQTPTVTHENNHTEDMDLDTDIEREKEKLPYSPTDKITASISMDTELLGIQPSDVSFISLNVTSSSPSFNTSPSQDDPKNYLGKIIENRSYLPNLVYRTSSQNTLYTNASNMQYAQANFTETSMKVHNPHANSHPYESTCNINNPSKTVVITSSQEMPYSPTDTPVYDPDLSSTLPQNLTTTSFSSLDPLESYSSVTPETSAPYNHISVQHVQTTNHIRNANEYDGQLNKAGSSLSLNPIVGFATTSVMESILPGNSMITIDDLPETDLDGGPLIDTAINAKPAEHIPNDLSCNKEKVPEPLYMKGVPDVTKDTNKIPTLINRTLVPASILKTNKNLQLPLPTKKYTTQQEPTFKNAEMLPVLIDQDTGTKTNTSFKPIKLISLPQKPHSTLVTPTAFNDSLQEDTTNELPTNKVHEKMEEPVLPQNDIRAVKNSEKVCDKSSTQKKGKSGKRGSKRKNSSTLPPFTKRHSCESSNSTKTVNEQINKPHVNVPDGSTSNEKNRISETNREKIQNSGDDKSKEDRRESLDEDEEALRAILLASLPKRTKATNNGSIPTVITTTSIVSNQTSSKVTTVNATNITNVNDTTLVRTPIVSVSGCENDKNQSNAEEKLKHTVQGNLSSDGLKMLNSIVSARKKSVPITRSPQKKLVKRTPIPASTKVVNNAKKYQNTMVQRRLNLQKATLSNKQKIGENKIISKVQSNENKWSVSTKAACDTQRLVISLESDTESDSESERLKNSLAASNSNTVEKRQISPINPRTDFEKNLEQFLRAARKKHESMTAAKPTSITQTPKKSAVATKSENANSSNVHTPLAVRHLPASQQEEYRRLKQQILEREKLKLMFMTKNKTAETSPKSVLPNSPTRVISPVAKNLNVNAQQLNKENFSKNLVNSIKPTTASINIQSSNNKTCNVDKQKSTNPNQVNLSPNKANKVVGIESTNEPRDALETSTPMIPKVPSGLKILSTDEVNRKYLQIQVRSDANERQAIVNDKVTLNDKTMSQNENRDHNPEKMNDQTHSAEKNLIPDSNMTDSDASTIILQREDAEKKESDTTSETTILLSHSETKDDDHSGLLNNDVSPGKGRVERDWEGIKEDVRSELRALISLPRTEQEQRLVETEQKLVTKRYTIIDDLAEMSATLRHWQMERELQMDLVAEVKKLREQLKVAEERLQEQRNRINSIGPKVVTAHGKVNVGRQECFKLATICSTLGSRIVGKEYNVPEAGTQLLDNKLKEVANHTRQLSRKKVPFINIPEVCISKLEKETVPIDCAEVFQVGNSEDFTADNDTMIFNANESLMNSTAIERVEQVEGTSANVDENASKENDGLRNSESSNKERTAENRIEVEAQESVNKEIAQNNKEASEDSAMRPTTSELRSEKENSTRNKEDLQTKTIMPYQSILIHFKSPSCFVFLVIFNQEHESQWCSLSIRADGNLQRHRLSIRSSNNESSQVAFSY
ncbi:uncharacterized protein LOC108623094 isoform X2 [Ceratina calcarata]|uniref:Uncharacterized protein LOC108623094 isoform X2 n=1 Tax=Ceratina calcarata TaxID=156304 RepID=A0AAJ7W954_9HYME|nr:uncharacterized protein LOC108623094 isoform X2 [Ceratina calcarata]